MYNMQAMKEGLKVTPECTAYSPATCNAPQTCTLNIYSSTTVHRNKYKKSITKWN